MSLRAVFVVGLSCLSMVMPNGIAMAADETDYARFTKATVEDYIRPATKELVRTFATLGEQTGQVCTTPSAGNKAAFNGAFRNAVTTLAAIDFFRFGPMAYNDTSHRLAFLPDSRGVVRRQVTKAVAKQDPTVTTPASLSIKSAALQGLTALERIAYDAEGNLVLGEGETPKFTCAFAESITINLSGTALELEANWADPNGFSKILLNPTMNGSLVQTHKEAAELVFNALKTAVELDKDQYLLVMVGKSAKKAKPAKAPFARSGNAVAYLSASLAGIENSIKTGGYTDGLDNEQSWVANSLRFEFRNAQKVLTDLPRPLRETGASPEVRGKLLYLITILGGLRDVMSADLAGYLGLSGGFNALDGD